MRATKHIALLAAAASLLLASCANYHVRKGEQAVGLMAYAKAEKHFDKALAHQQGRDLLLLTAEAEAKQNKVVQAAEHFAAAEKIAPLTGSDAFQYGRMMMALGEYEKAEPMLLRALQDDPERQDAADLIGACQGYRSFYSDSSRYTVTPLQFAGMATAYSATPSVGGLIFAAQRQASAGRKDPWTGLSFTDLYQVAVGADGATSIPSPLKGAVNGPYHEGSAALSADGKTLYFTRSNYYGNKLLKDNDNVSNLKMFRATKEENGGWGNIREFGYNSAGYSVGLPALSTDGNTLYFTSDMPGGLGGKDLWYSTDIGTGWGAPVNMGPTINTSGDEMFPTVVGDALYFSSTGHTNMGGLDIFETHKEGEFWSEPKNMGYPVNTTRDDFGLWLDSTGTKGYLSCEGTGSDQIYALNVHPLLFAVEGTITNVKTGKPLPGSLVTLRNLITKLDTQVTADASGQFHFDVRPNTAYSVSATNVDMLAQSTPASTAGLGLSTTLRADLQLEPLELNKPIAVPNIYYDYDKWDIRPDAAMELNKLAKIFMDNPGLTFELSSHTDSRGGDTYNLVLSDARARSAVDYLERQGVPPDRLIAMGYGETMPVNGCVNGVKCTEEEHQANRRTEFKVISRDAVGQSGTTVHP
ncbi:MAG: OmpA family protein [Flavobacteriales bacterium]|nr:OmpA family protein [Flavobacteriales bacterium]